MKLAEALTQQKDLKGKIAKAQTKLHQKLTVLKLTPDVPVPDNDALIKEITELSEKLANLKNRIAASNVKHGLAGKIYQLQEAEFLVTMLEPLTTTEQKTVEFHGGGYGQQQEKVDVHATFDVAKAKELHATQQKRLRELDLELQKQNWLIDLVE